MRLDKIVNLFPKELFYCYTEFEQLQYYII